MTFTYPAILHPDTNSTFWVEFPDLPGCLTYGHTVEEAMDYARDVLGCFLSTDIRRGVPFAAPSDIADIDGRGDQVVLVTADVPDTGRAAV